MRLSVISHFVAVLGNRYGYLNIILTDNKLAVHDFKHYVGKVRICVLEVVRNNAHVIGSGIGLGYGPVIRLGFLHGSCYIVQIIVCYHALVTRDRVRLSVKLGRSAVLGDRYSNLCGYRIDRQCSAFECYYIVSRNTGDLSLFVSRQILHRAFADIGNGRSFGKKSLDRCFICFQRTLDRVLTIQRVPVINLFLGLCGNRQRQRIVDLNQVARDLNRDFLARIIVIYCQILFLIFGLRCCFIFLANNLILNRISFKCCRLAKQIMLHSDRHFVEIKVKLQNGASVASNCCTENARFFIYKFILVVLGLGFIGISYFSSRISLRLASRSKSIVDYILTVLVLIIELNSIIDIHCFPLRI